MKSSSLLLATYLFGALSVSAPTIAMSVSKHQAEMTTSSTFEGPEVKAGKVTFSVENGKNVLTLSKDFTVPKAPSPHWQVVESNGDVFTLKRLDIKGGKFNKSIVLPKYIHDVASVRIYCTWAEVTLGEAKFSSPIKIMDGGN